jgi:succinoglycan biosynthesis protein ExoM
MTENQPHISVCICTYKRPEYLQRLLAELADQDTGGLFTYSIVVAENDQLRSAESVVSAFASTSCVPVIYCVEPRQGIALARNQAVRNAHGDYVAFIDDDEFPVKHWLLNLFKTLREHKAEGVLGPVKPHFDAQTPQWVIEGGFYDRPMHPTGLVLDWQQCRTGNVLLKSALFASQDQPFRPECLQGEDLDFFQRMTAKENTFIWCNEAVAYEVVPPSRWKRSFLVRRALFRGVFSLRNHGFPPMRILQSVIAAPAYAVALPVALVLGQGRFMRYVFKLSYHVGRLLAVVGVNPIDEPYVTS